VQSGANSTFDTSTSSVAASLSTSVARDQDLLSTVRTLLEIGPRTTNAQLRMWLSADGAVARFPGVFGFTYIEHVQSANLAAYAAAVRVDPPVPPFRGTFTIIPKGARAPYCFTRLIYAQLPKGVGGGSATGIISSLGPLLSPSFDYCDTPFDGLLQVTARSGHTGVIRLAQLFEFPTKGGPSIPPLVRSALGSLPLFAIVTPVYNDSANLATVGDREAASQGWVLGLFDATGIFQAANGVAHGVAVTLYHRSAGNPVVVLRSSISAKPAGRSRVLALRGNGGWTVKVSESVTPTGLSATAQGIAVLVGGLLVALLLFAIVEVLVVSRRNALRLVEVRTKDLRYQSTHDALTGLPNRVSVYEQAQAALGQARRSERAVALFFIDLDDFKKVNDTFGHGIGDDLLRSVGERLVAAVGDAGSVGRLGGDEFAVLAEDTDVARQPELFASRLQEVMREPFELPSGGGFFLSITASIGVATGPRRSSEELLRDADTALFRAKAEGLGRFAVFEPEMHDAARKRLALDIDLRQAMSVEQFYVVYQPIVDLRTETIYGVEALLRWQHPRRGVVMPQEFISILEESDLILEVGRYVLDQACTQARRWHEAGFPVGVSVNLSARQFNYNLVLDDVPMVLSRTGAEASWMTLEMTESIAMMQTELMVGTLQALRSLGLRLAIDDFGTGYSSLAYLREFPIDILKIDRSFIEAIEQPQGKPFLEALIKLGHSLDLEIVAEGIERRSQLEILVEEGCDSGQGFLFLPPVEPAELTARFERDGLRLVPSDVHLAEDTGGGAQTLSD
jgi:diguanylate cyclase (GGDEF)-like protein